jgi:hypothetical protein
MRNSRRKSINVRIKIFLGNTTECNRDTENVFSGICGNGVEK